VARALGTSEPVAAQLLSRLSGRVGPGSAFVRAVGLVLATSRARRLVPPGLRQRAVEAAVFRLVEEHADTAILLGLRKAGEPRCRGLGPP
jgi:hypothetical protein